MVSWKEGRTDFQKKNREKNERCNTESVDFRKELEVSSTTEKVREMRLCWYGHMQRME